MVDEILVQHVSVDGAGIHVAFTNGREVTAPLTERLEAAGRQERGEWVLVGGGVGVHWPVLDEHLSAEGLWYENLPPNPPLLRECRFCDERTRWDSERCDSCGKERWNDPDDTEMGRELGRMERTNYKTAVAAKKLDRAVDNMLDEFLDASMNGELDQEAIDADLRKMTRDDE